MIIPECDDDSELIDPVKIATQLSVIHQKEDDLKQESQQKTETSKLSSIGEAQKDEYEKSNSELDEPDMKETVKQDIECAAMSKRNSDFTYINPMLITDTFKPKAEPSDPTIREQNFIEFNVISEMKEIPLLDGLHQAVEAHNNSERASVSDAARNSDLSLNSNMK